MSSLRFASDAMQSSARVQTLMRMRRERLEQQERVAALFSKLTDLSAELRSVQPEFRSDPLAWGGVDFLSAGTEDEASRI
jgi:hypothetical protein